MLLSLVHPLLAQDGPSVGVVFLYVPTGLGYSGNSNGDGTFTFTSVSVSPNFNIIRLGDFNGDRIADLILYNSVPALAYLGLGTGTSYNFSGLSWSPAYNFVVTGDFNGDGKTDLILYNSSGIDEYTALANGGGGFTYIHNFISAGFTQVLAADFNGDGKADLFLYRASDGVAYLGLSNGDGTFAFSPVTLPAGFVTGFDRASTGDLNGDGMADVLLYNSTSGAMVSALSTGTNFTFSTQTRSSGYSSVLLFDCNGDGKADVMLYDKLQHATTYLGMGRGDGTFAMTSMSMSGGNDNMFAMDANGDGFEDLLMYNSSSGYQVTALSNGTGGFNYNPSVYWGPGRIMTVRKPVGTIQTFLNCLNGSGRGANASVCTIPTGTYTLTSPLVIGRSGVTVKGGSGDRTKTLLVRGQNLTLPIMQIGNNGYSNQTTPLTAVTIENLTFCGAAIMQHDALGHPDGDPNNPCPATQVETACESAPGGCGVPDLFITNTAPGQSWAAPAQAPFSNTGPYNLTIQNNKFEDSPSGHPIFIAPTGTGQIVNDVLVRQNTISSGGVQIGEYNMVDASGNLVNFGDYTQCDNWQAVHVTAFADDTTTVTVPRNIRFDSNTYYVNQGALGGFGRYVQFNNNTINHYYWPTGAGGGAIEQEQCADQVKITYNTLNGNWQAGSTEQSGMELYSRNLTVSNNAVSNYAFEGIGVFSTFKAVITNNNVYGNDSDPNTQGGDGEIKIATRFPGVATTCYPYASQQFPGKTCDAFRDTQNLTVQNNYSSSNINGLPYPIYLVDGIEGSTNHVGINVIDGTNTVYSSVSTEVGIYPNVTLTGSITASSSVTSGGAIESIAIFPEGNQPLGQPLGPGDPATQDRRFFRFGGTSYLGSGDLEEVLGFLSTTSSGPANQPGFGGPFITAGAYCHFLYFTPANASRTLYPPNTIFLDDTNPGDEYHYNSGSSMIGPGGRAISNGKCTIHADTSSYQLATGNLTLILDIEFAPGSGTWYMYEADQSFEGLTNSGNQVVSPPPPATPYIVNPPWSLWGYWKAN